MLGIGDWAYFRHTVVRTIAIRGFARHLEAASGCATSCARRGGAGPGRTAKFVGIYDLTGTLEAFSQFCLHAPTLPVRGINSTGCATQFARSS